MGDISKSKNFCNKALEIEPHNHIIKQDLKTIQSVETLIQLAKTSLSSNDFKRSFAYVSFHLHPFTKLCIFS